MDSLTISNTVARGGRGGGPGGGGGGGLGGGLFVTGTNAGLNSGAAVRLTNVTFSNDQAIGGAGNGTVGPYAQGGGGGGLGGDGGSGSGGGGGGVGGAGSTYGGAGRLTYPGAPGIILGAAKAGDSEIGQPGDMFNVGGPNGGGGGAGPIVISDFYQGGGGGVGGADAANNGGNGGFGGGGGGGTILGGSGGNGGFGGGGGSPGGNGGFGGGGGAWGAEDFNSPVPIIPNGVGGFGGGDGSAENTTNRYGTHDGGGGLGAGGAIFVQQGGSLTIANGGIAGGAAIGGAHGVATGDLPTDVGNGLGLGAGIFLQGNQTINLSSDIGQTTIIGDVIADMTGSGGAGANAGGGIVSASGAGVVVLAAANTYSGGTLINGTTLELAATGAAGTGAISFIGSAPATLKIDAAAMVNPLANPILGFGAANRLDLAGLRYDRSASAVIGAHNLVVQSAGGMATLNLADTADSSSFVVTSDGSGGVMISEANLPVTDIGSGPDTIVLAISEAAYLGDAQFTVSVNANQIGGLQTASAAHVSGQDQLFAVHGNFGSDARAVTVDFRNDAYGGSGQADRNLYVDRIDNSGVTSYPNTALYNGGPVNFLLPPLIQPTVIGTGADRIDLNLSEDAYAGNEGGNDAMFTIGIDGVQVGGVQTAIAKHGAGQTQDFAVLGSFGAGPHNVSIAFLNDAYGGTSSTDRNLYVDSISRAGGSQSVQTAFYNQGTQNFVV